MTIYALSGIAMIFRRTDSFKIEKQKTAALATGWREFVTRALLSK